MRDNITFNMYEIQCPHCRRKTDHILNYNGYPVGYNEDRLPAHINHTFSELVDSGDLSDIDYIKINSFENGRLSVMCYECENEREADEKIITDIAKAIENKEAYESIIKLHSIDEYEEVSNESLMRNMRTSCPYCNNIFNIVDYIDNSGNCPCCNKLISGTVVIGNPDGSTIEFKY